MSYLDICYKCLRHFLVDFASWKDEKDDNTALVINFVVDNPIKKCDRCKKKNKRGLEIYMDKITLPPKPKTKYVSLEAVLSELKNKKKKRK